MNQNLHIKVNKTDMADYVLLAGDPARLNVVAKFLNKPKEVFYQREFRIIKGKYQGIKLLAVSTGIGAPSTAIVMEELIRLGAKVFIRIGTCGGAWRSDVKIGSLIIPTACVRGEGTTREYIGLSFPAVADFTVASSLIEAAKKRDLSYYVGINRTHDAFYGNVDDKQNWRKRFKNLNIKNSPILSSDMETSVLYVLASLRGVKAGAILAVNANPEPLLSKNIENPVIESNKVISRKVVGKMINVALDSLIIYQQAL